MEVSFNAMGLKREQKQKILCLFLLAPLSSPPKSASLCLLGPLLRHPFIYFVLSAVAYFFHDHIIPSSHARVSTSPFQPYYTNRASLPPNSGPRGVPQSSGARPVTPHVYQAGPGSQMMMIPGQQLPFPSSPQGPAYFIPGQVGHRERERERSGFRSCDAGWCSLSICFSLHLRSTDQRHTLRHPSNTQSKRERQASTQAPALLNMVLMVRGSSQGLTPATHTPTAQRLPQPPKVMFHMMWNHLLLFRYLQSISQILLKKR